MRKVFIIWVLSIALFSCKVDNSYKEELKNADYLYKSLDNLTDIIVHDIFSPPVASRVYAYPAIAAYEILASADERFKSLSGQITGFDLDVVEFKNNEVSDELAAVIAFNKVGKALIFSEDKMDAFTSELYKNLKNSGIPKSVWNNSQSYGEAVAEAILIWADKDMYKQSRSMPKYSISDQVGTWKPTPPAYMEGIEPNWRVIRPMVIDSANQFKPNSPPEFDMAKESDFYKLVKEVEGAVNNATEEHRLIASFWDCNPFVMNQKGHMMFATKKITPGGHWMGITQIASKKIGADMNHASELIAMVSIALFDAFISCWDEKYRSNLIRPETVINEYLDADWVPVLQTPPFPEHTSGHSVISTASAHILTNMLGEDFAFNDDVEVKYGLPERKFDSFLDASNEAAISRLYGGIHYMPAIEDGVSQGKKVGEFIISSIKTRNN